MKKKSLFKSIIIISVIFLLLLCTAVFSQSEKDPVKRMTGTVSFYSPVEYKNLTIIPLKATVPGGKVQAITLDEAMSDKSLDVTEINQGGSVNQLSITNNSNSYVFIMAGEIMQGSKQDRILKDDTLLPPKSGKILVNVYCVEHGRWTYQSDKFYSGEKNANISVRQKAKESGSQSRVWEEVDKTQKELNYSNSTQSLSKTYEAPEVKKEQVNYGSKFDNIPSNYPDANGVVVLVNDKVLVADIFSDTRTFKKLWKKLLNSYTLEAMSKINSSVDSTISDHKAFLRYVQDAKITYTTASGKGQNVDIRSEKITGSGLVHDGTPLHLDIFPNSGKKYEEPIPQIRRNYDNSNIQQQQINAPVQPQTNQ